MNGYEDAADRMQDEAEDMQRASDRLEEDIRDTRADWERKQGDSQVPGAEAPDHDQADKEPPRPEIAKEGEG